MRTGTTFTHRAYALLKQAVALNLNERQSGEAILPKHPLAQHGARILPPFLGEMGLEVRGFLGQIEPWLRAGWMIPARRPALYPSGSAFHDPDFFEKLDDIKRVFHLYEISGRLTCNIMPGAMTSSLSSTAGGQLELRAVSENRDGGLIALAQAEKALRTLYFQRYGSSTGIRTRWDYDLLSLSDDTDPITASSMGAIPPSYLPESYTRSAEEFMPHIGVQIRIVPSRPSRNSNMERIQELVELAGAECRLPVIVYGRFSDGSLPGMRRSVDFISQDEDQLAGELGLLSKCRLMISPDSGWADLMGWLRVPTLLERQYFDWGFEALEPFRPRMLVASLEPDTTRQRIRQLLTSEGLSEALLPDPQEAELHGSHLSPRSDINKQYWDEFGSS
ncbi:hypothetical protein [Paraburkholderia caballeronis]|uniref:hypothetical protein n=1 Tax=Paraburkholderia caballeronis TaxID=416943 RepID=UPI001065D492|nr:hypothetical protein [Paraburkholderia caballeronis]TDV16298.1 hypothetical protein C7406_108159 [Paraburkholderia caballeronis]TDV20648.1 hypothetical protein C7408_101159 [Paraburkholderia caballeronis]TDV33116.1 hypothetical protein C7404_101255 [Paraburkholderia caballeronis]